MDLLTVRRTLPGYKRTEPQHPLGVRSAGLALAADRALRVVPFLGEGVTAVVRALQDVGPIHVRHLNTHGERVSVARTALDTLRI